MAKYRQIHVSYWQDPFILDLTPEEKYFYVYLMTNSKTSACGIYELPKKVLELETGYNRETVDKLLSRFVDYGKIAYCEATREVYIINWLRYNEPKSDNTAKCVVAELNSVKNRAFAGSYIKQAEALGYPLEGACKGIDSPYQVIDKEKEKDKEKETETDKNINAPSVAGGVPPCPHDEIIKAYHEILPTCPTVRAWTDTRRRYLQARWREDSKRQNLEWWKEFFRYVGQSSFLTGKTKSQNGKPPFLADLEWLITAGNFVKVVEGKYHKEAA